MYAQCMHCVCTPTFSGAPNGYLWEKVKKIKHWETGGITRRSLDEPPSSPYPRLGRSAPPTEPLWAATTPSSENFSTYHMLFPSNLPLS